MSHFHKKLIAIKESEAYEELEAFKSQEVWEKCQTEERQLLVRLLMKHGQQQLSEGNQKVLESFETAAKISSYCTDVLLQQALMLAQCHQNVRCLMIAYKIFSQVIDCMPENFKALFGRANVAMQRGCFENELVFFTDADSDFQKAFLCIDSDDEISKSNFYWKWANCKVSQAHFSGEPLDFQCALEKYHYAFTEGCVEPQFFLDFGNACADLGSLLNKNYYFEKAYELFQEATLIDEECYQGWFNQACCLQKLSIGETFHEKMPLIHHLFSRAVDLNPHQVEYWFKWAQFDAYCGKRNQNITFLKSALEKFSKAFEIDCDFPFVLCQWADTELFLSSFEEKLEYIHSAQKKVISHLKVHSQDIQAWYLYGLSMNELGRYFSDERYFLQAIQKFEYGLTLSAENPLIWYGLAISYFSLGEMMEDKENFEYSIECFSKVEKYKGMTTQFWNDWGVVCMRLGELTNNSAHIEAALLKFEKALNSTDHQATKNEGIDLEWVCNYGSAFDLLGDITDEPQHFEKAIQILSQVLQIDSGYQQARYNLALALSHFGESLYDIEAFEQALEHYHYLLKNDPEDELIHLDLGMALISWGLIVEDSHNPQKSHELFKQAEHHLMFAANLGNYQAFYQLAGLYSINGHFDHSIHFLQRAQQANVLPALEDLLHEEWIEKVSQTQAFKEFILDISNKDLEE